MKPMTLNMSKMKKIAGDKKTSTFQHEDGHTIKVLHSALPAIQRKQLEKLPVHEEPKKMAKGGQVKMLAEEGDPAKAPSIDMSNLGDPNQVPADQTSAQKPSFMSQDQWDNLSPALKAAQDDPGRAETPVSAPSEDRLANAMAANKPGSEYVNPNMDKSMIAPAFIQPATQSAPVSTNKPLLEPDNKVTSDINEIEKSIGTQGDLSSILARRTEQIDKDNFIAKQMLHAESVADRTRIENEGKDLFIDYKNSKVDPDQYQRNQGIASKINSTIGILLGGFGQGLIGGNNAALDMLNKHIEDNIESQKLDIGKKKSLYEFNQQQWKDNNIAENLTRAHLNDVMADRINIAAQNIADPMAQARAKQAANQFDLNANAARDQAAARSAAIKAINAGGTGLSPRDLATAGIGGMTQEQATKEQASLDAQHQAVSNIMNIFGEFQKENTAGNLLNPMSYRSVGPLKARLTNAIMSADVNHRLTPETVDMQLAPYIPSTIDFAGNGATAVKKLNDALQLTKTMFAPDTPLTRQFAPKILPNYDLAAPRVKGHK